MKGKLDVKELETYKKADIQKLARELGVSDEGTIKEIAERCAGVEVEIPDEGQPEEQPEEKKAAGQQPEEFPVEVGDEVTVTGKCYADSVTGGMFNKVEKRKMYVTQVLNDKKYKYPIGVAKQKGGTRHGWISVENIVN